MDVEYLGKGMMTRKMSTWNSQRRKKSQESEMIHSLVVTKDGRTVAKVGKKLYEIMEMEVENDEEPDIHESANFDEAYWDGANGKELVTERVVRASEE